MSTNRMTCGHPSPPLVRQNLSWVFTPAVLLFYDIASVLSRKEIITEKCTVLRKKNLYFLKKKIGEPRLRLWEKDKATLPPSGHLVCHYSAFPVYFLVIVSFPPTLLFLVCVVLHRPQGQQSLSDCPPRLPVFFRLIWLILKVDLLGHSWF